MERFTTEEDCKRLGLRPVEPSPYPVHMPIPAPQQLGKLGLGWVRVVCHACKLQYDVDQIEHYRHPSVLHVAEFVCSQGHIAQVKLEQYECEIPSVETPSAEPGMKTQRLASKSKRSLE